jgi:hypothetical protein
MVDILSMQEWIQNFETYLNQHTKVTKVERRKI